MPRGRVREILVREQRRVPHRRRDRGLRCHRPIIDDQLRRALIGPRLMSGGQRQRIGFAQALGLRPKLIVADEPVSMLDVSIRIGILNLMTELREREDVLQRPKHPYTQLLLSAVPDPKAKLGLADTIDVGEPPRAVNPTPGCRFWQRCPRTASSPAKG
ncbi:MAG TPA: oligopeptide/dipeptide ABC transporter ATP-binding protein [Gaiellaceae bacterium]|nr:oligopeptide/dipeptide ABC transporter ATP-binding protein [Gaiellaceae bacterium]